MHGLGLARRKRHRQDQGTARALASTGEMVGPWRDQLPFTLTGDQERACQRIDKDVAADRPMQRLLMGEVGSGKTAVATAAMLRALENGRQAALMAPTETLAEQHLLTLDRLLAGRGPVETHVIDGARVRARAYERIREEIAQGRQCFVVCPLVEESEALQAKAAVLEAERLQQSEFSDHRVQLIHGQMPTAQKQDAMRAFASGTADVLVATSVIEVGIDVPNATVMLIEEAERYGISQLHQLRGRIGRGQHPGLCILFGDPQNPRLAAVASHRDRV